MSKSYNPVRGFFIGYFSYWLALTAAVAFLCYPAAIQADAVTITVPATKGTLATAPQQTGATRVWLTAYASVPQETSNHPFITASGEHVRDGIVAADFLPFGTEIKIPSLFGNKIFTVEDRMNRVFSKRIDIWMPTVDAAVDFGIRHAGIVIVKENTLAER